MTPFDREQTLCCQRALMLNPSETQIAGANEQARAGEPPFFPLQRQRHAGGQNQRERRVHNRDEIPTGAMIAERPKEPRAP